LQVEVHPGLLPGGAAEIGQRKRRIHSNSAAGLQELALRQHVARLRRVDADRGRCST
jgi:hypothetical protein